MNVIKTVRGHWKKAVALVAVGTFGFNFAQKKYRLVT